MKTKTDLFLDQLMRDAAKDPKQSPTLTHPSNVSGLSGQEKKDMIRGLMNVRMPRPLPEDLLQLQDDFLQEALAEKGVVSLSDIPTVRELRSRSILADKTDRSSLTALSGITGKTSGKMSGNASPYEEWLSLWQGDITKLETGAIVNAANSRLLGCFLPCHRCIDNAIHSAAGMQLREECHQIMTRRRAAYGVNYEEPVGTATLTDAYNLPCHHVIHTVGPIVYGELSVEHCRSLQNCYENILNCCLENHIRSVALCCISTGEFHFPNEKAAQIAVETVTAFLEAHGGQMERIIFNVFTDRDRIIYERLLGLCAQSESPSP